MKNHRDRKDTTMIQMQGHRNRVLRNVTCAPSLLAGSLLAGSLLACSLVAGCKAQRQAEDDPDHASAPVQLRVEHAKPVSRDETTAAQDGRPVIACFGDSLTAGYGVDEDRSYPAVLQQDLDAAGFHYRVVNMGISGDTTKDGLSRIDRVLAMKPSVVVLEFGGNDGLRGVPVASSRANLDTMLERLKQSGTKVALAGVTLPPQYSTPYIKEFNASYTLLAKKYGTPLLPFVLDKVYGIPGSIQQDGIHPTAQGCKQVAQNIFDLVRPLLKKA